MIHRILSFTCQDLTNIKDFVKLNCLDKKIDLQPAQEIIRMIDDLEEKLLKVMEETSKQLKK